ncbi:enhanced intracellular survival protein Eis [Mycobacterium celatum]|uniref:N-acetyltransferase Eis n=1 Tax=Mycobacterium celatum TaxID=28045 RepID=A0A2G5PPW0_MYCCE|nr:enhanced intracellular survival protein Eis [Mycobacterium celatum]PIB80348.1 enhanced intracellular survival protein Eis [Mycobacterium celatum]
MPPSNSVTAELPEPLTLRTATDDDWPAILLLDDTSFGVSTHPDSISAFRALTPPDAAVVVCDHSIGEAVVGFAVYLDLQLTVPGGTALRASGLSGVSVAPTHRRRGLLRAMFTELHRRIADSGYPMAALTASEGGIYGRFGYGPATIEHELTLDRRFARFHDGAPDPGGVRLVRPAQQKEALAAIYERWRRRTPGGLVRPQALWDELLADRETTRRGGTPWFAFVHPDGYALYRVHGGDRRTARVSELKAVTTDAHVALWRTLLGLDLIETVTVDTHPADPLPYLLADSRLARTTGRQDDLWLRIMDIPAALQARTYGADLSTVFEVSDGFRGDGGRFTLEIEDGRARCTTTDAPAEAEMDLDVLGSLYLGAHHASAFAAANRLRAKDSALVRRLDAAFVSDIPAQLGFGF